VYVRNVDGSPAIRLGEGGAQGFSPDGKSVLAVLHPSGERRLVSYPVGPGEVRTISEPGLAVATAQWHPDGKRILLQASETDRGPRFYLQDVSGGKARPFTPEGYRGYGVRPLTPDGKYVITLGPDRKVYRYPLEGGEPMPVPGLSFDERAIGWTPDGRFVFSYRRGERPAKVFRVDVATGQRELFRELMPSDPSGVDSVGPILLLPDGKSVIFGYVRVLSDLHVVDGLK
jgi:hypothetical protein